MKKHAFISFAATLFFFTAFCGCKKENVEKTNNNELPYLNIKIPEDQSQLTETDLNILMEGFQRLNVQHNKEGFLVPTLSAQEANLSKELYAYLMQMIDHTNKIIKGSREWSATHPGMLQ
ncbi:MAG TPA: hypothetical protein H9818_05385 [Candidatus Phocaeicola gallistercoris]|nr:hypothetical protein [Candidatus Phocaeicola gallistercoris]